LLKIARRENIGWKEFRKELVRYLGGRMEHPDGDGEIQVRRAREMFKPLGCNICRLVSHRRPSRVAAAKRNAVLDRLANGWSRGTISPGKIGHQLYRTALNHR
jgi:hypothetical protein